MKKIIAGIIIFALVLVVPSVLRLSADEGDAYSYESILQWGSPGAGDGQFLSPTCVAVDTMDNVYVVDNFNFRIQKFGSNGNLITKWGKEGFGNGEFLYPACAAIDSMGNVYVTDSYLNRIQKFDSNGNFIKTWGIGGIGDGEFQGPTGIAVDSVDNVYVSDFLNHRVQKFDSNGDFIAKWGSGGSGNGEFLGPMGIVVDEEGNVYVVDNGNARIQKFDSNGVFITAWGALCSPLPADFCPDGEFNYPTGIAVDSENNVYVADTGRWRIQKFDSRGNFIFKWGKEGVLDGQFEYPTGIAIDSADNVYVSDQVKHQVQKFSVNFAPVAICKNIEITAGENCEASIVADDVDGGSHDPDDDAITLSIDNLGPFSLGEHYVNLTVTEDIWGKSDSCQAKVNVVGSTPPVADDQSVETDQISPVDITLTASDADEDSLTYSVVTQPQHGTLSGEAPNLTYTPNPNFKGKDSFTFKANDGCLDSNTAKVTIKVKGLIVVVKLLDSQGNGIKGGTVKYYDNGWKKFGKTDASGQVSKELSPKTYNFRMTYAHASNEKTQDVGSDPIVIFQTVNVLVELKDSDGNGLSGGSVKYHASGWKKFGTTGENGQVRKELLPKTYNFRMTYGGISQEKAQDVGTDPSVEFTTATVTVKLMNSDGTGLPGGSVKYHASGWKKFGTTDENGEVSKELLAGEYNFRMTYGGVSQEKPQDVSTDPIVEFTTAKVTVKLMASDGSGLSGGSVKYHGSGWKKFGTTDDNGEVSKELLAGEYNFRMTYEGTSQEKEQDVSTDPIVEFTTVTATVKLMASDGSGLSGGVVKYHGSGWKKFGTTDENGQVRKELLPKTYNFRMTYGGISKEKAQDVSTDPIVEFTTATVTVKLMASDGSGLSGGVVKYHGSGWKKFGTTDANGEVSKELLASEYRFRMTYGGASVEKEQDVRTDPVVEFATVKVTVKLTGDDDDDDDGNKLSGGVVKYHAGGWKKFGTTDSSGQVSKELLAGEYKFRMTYDGDKEEKIQDVSTDPIVVFQTD